MDRVLAEFKQALYDKAGYSLAETINPIAPPHDSGRLYAFYKSTNAFAVQGDIRDALGTRQNSPFVSREEGNAWIEVYVAYWKAIGTIIAAEEATNRNKFQGNEWGIVYDAWKEVANALIKGHATSQFDAWSIPCLYLAGKYLRIFAIKADAQSANFQGEVTFTSGIGDDIVSSTEKNEKLEDAARQLMRIFSLFQSDRSSIDESRKWGIYYMANLLFKTHFKLNSIHLSKNILKALQNQADLPELERFPMSHQATFKYYSGVIFFLEEDYIKSEALLTEALRMCHKSAKRNRELILTYLIPCHLLTTHTLPTPTLLSPYPHLQALFGPLSTAIRRGDLGGFDAALTSGEEEFVKRRIYLPLERCRDICMRNLFRRIYLLGGFESAKDGGESGEQTRRTRIPLGEFEAGLRVSMGEGEGEMEKEEVECLVANLIYKNLMKGYISREHGKVVLSKGGKAFPGTGV